MATMVVRMMWLMCFLLLRNGSPGAPTMESWKWLPTMASPAVRKTYIFYDEWRASRVANLPNLCGRRLSDLWYLPSLSAAKPACAHLAMSHASGKVWFVGSPLGAVSHSTFLQLHVASRNFSLIESASSHIIELSTLTELDSSFSRHPTLGLRLGF
jgi:hypothetical protein